MPQISIELWPVTKISQNPECEVNQAIQNLIEVQGCDLARIFRFNFFRRLSLLTGFSPVLPQHS